MPTYAEVKAAEDRVVEAAASLLSFLEDVRAGERLNRALHILLVEELRTAATVYARLITQLAAEA